MSSQEFRTVHDSMGEMKVPHDALYGASTARAVNNFPISNLTMPIYFIKQLALIKKAAAFVNSELKLIDNKKAEAIMTAADKIIKGELNQHFPIDIFQTGSGTSTNMNVNEVIANYAHRNLNIDVHPNDDVNMGQSSNDTIPTAIKVSAVRMVHEKLIPSLNNLLIVLENKKEQVKHIIKTGRTHLMDAMPISFAQELSSWQQQITSSLNRIQDTLKRSYYLPQGGTAIGTGINAHPEFGKRIAEKLAKDTNIPFKTAPNYFEQIATQDDNVELSGQLKVLACALMKIANDLRWMNSGPLTGLAEIELQALQPGSSIMPGKVNPVIPEAVCMVAAQIMGNDATITIAGQAGNFELNVMLPVIAYNLLHSIEIASNACNALANHAIKTFTINEQHIKEKLALNPILVTALNPIIGYEKAAKIAKLAYKNKMPVVEVALQETDLSRKELEKLLDPAKLTCGGISS